MTDAPSTIFVGDSETCTDGGVFTTVMTARLLVFTVKAPVIYGNGNRKVVGRARHPAASLRYGLKILQHGADRGRRAGGHKCLGPLGKRAKVEGDKVTVTV